GFTVITNVSFAPEPTPPTVTVGSPGIAPPTKAVDPQTGLVFSPPIVTLSCPSQAASIWGAKEQRLYLLQSCTYLINWQTSSDPSTLSDPVVQIVQAVWPASPQICVASAPVELNSASSSYRVFDIQSEAKDAVGYKYDSQTSTLVVPQPGWTTISYA